MTVASPVSGSSRITLLASLFANSIVPPSSAMMPSALLPSQDQTTRQRLPASITPGIAVSTVGSAGGGGAASAAAPPPPSANGAGGDSQRARTAGKPGSCHACKLCPRENADDGLCASAAGATEAKSTA